jgi:hypothetical protein
VYDPQQEAGRDLLDAIMPAVCASHALVHIIGQTTEIIRASYEVLAETGCQDLKWGKNRDLPDYEWLAILSEEVGEVAQAALQTQYGGPHAGTVRKELVQVAAVALQWIANIDRRTAKESEGAQ